MSKRLGLAATLLVALLCSCSSLITAYLVNNYLNDKAPTFTWRGSVVDADNRGIADATIRVRAEVPADTTHTPLDFTGTTDGTGHYAVAFKWSAKVSYRVSVLQTDVVVAEHNVGSISKGDQRDDFTLDGGATSSNLHVSGVVTDASGNPIKDALVLVGSAATDGGAVTFFKTTTPAATAYVQTSAGGIYQLDGVANAHVVAVAFHPDHGFAYATGVDEDGDGDLALNLAMGHTGTFNVQAQVVDGVGTPVASQVLDPTRQFRLRLRTPYDLSAEVNSVVSAHALFPTFSGTPSDLQPQTKLLTVQSTGVGGIADGTLSVAGGAYVLDLLKIDTNDPATALVTSTNPLPLAGNATVVVRVN